MQLPNRSSVFSIARSFSAVSAAAAFCVIANKTIKGEHSDRTERTIGIELFGRIPDYDTNVDPTVRVAATELRKRLTRYSSSPVTDRNFVSKFLSVLTWPGSACPRRSRFFVPDPLPLARAALAPRKSCIGMS